MCAELEAANAKGNSRQVFQIPVVKSMTQKFQPCLQCIQSATGENLTEAAQIADRWKGYCEELYHDEEGNGTEQEYWEKEPPPLHSEVVHVIRLTASYNNNNNNNPICKAPECQKTSVALADRNSRAN